MKLKPKDIPVLRDKLAKEQGNVCRLCGIDLAQVVPCLDHDHITGRVRAVLCNNCNGIEGKIFNLVRRAKREANAIEFINRIRSYWITYTDNPRQEIHPSHKSPDEKRIARNKKARERRRKNKC
jgi:hypothetical protein